MKLILSEQYEASHYGNVLRNSLPLNNQCIWQYVKASGLSNTGFDKHHISLRLHIACWLTFIFISLLTVFWKGSVAMNLCMTFACTFNWFANQIAARMMTCAYLESLDHLNTRACIIWNIDRNVYAKFPQIL